MLVGYNGSMATKLSKDAFTTALPIFLAVVPFLTSAVLFVVALVFIELSGGLGKQPESTLQVAFANIGDVSAALAYLIFSVVVPLGVIAGIILFVWRLLAPSSKK